MPDPIGATRLAPGALRLTALVLCAALTGCAIETPLILADPGKYQYFNCEQLAKANTQQTARQRELKELIEKAEQGAGGVVVSMMAYRSDYLAVNEDLRVIESTARNKNCVTTSTWQSNNAIR